MAKGDTLDLTNRIFRMLPAGWFPSQSGTRIYATVQGFAAAFTAIWQQIVYARLQTRLQTTTDGWVDLASQDFFGTRLPRRRSESDGVFSQRIRDEVIRLRNTRAALIAAAQDVTGRPAAIFEPFNPYDTGGWDTPALAWDTAGAWGDETATYTAFLNVGRPLTFGLANLAGWDSAIGGWNIGSISWIDDDDANSSQSISDADIYAAIAAVVPAGMIVWVSISGSAPTVLQPGLGIFTLDANFLT